MSAPARACASAASSRTAASSIWKARASAFAVTDGNAEVPVRYTGLLPDLFREGQGVVAEGALEPSGEFRADSVLAKHDENYMPREVADALKKQGVWNEGRRTTAPRRRRARAARGRNSHDRRGSATTRSCSPSRSSIMLTVLPFWGAMRRDDAADDRGAAGRRSALFALRRVRLWRADVRLCGVDFSSGNVVRELPFDQAADLQDLRRVVEPRGLDAPVGASSSPLRGAAHGAPLRAPCRSACSPTRCSRAGAARRGLPRFHPARPPTRSRGSSPAPFEGAGLNPILQDPGLAIHPPLLYLGYVGFSVVVLASRSAR